MDSVCVLLVRTFTPRLRDSDDTVGRLRDKKDTSQGQEPGEHVDREQP
jgi:hypothetical protein